VLYICLLKSADIPPIAVGNVINGIIKYNIMIIYYSHRQNKKRLLEKRLLKKGILKMRKSEFTNDVQKLATKLQAKERYKLSTGTIMKIATQANAVRRIGRSVRIDIEVLDKAIEENYSK
jgi:hypothetical protein